MTITIDPKVEARLRERAAAEEEIASLALEGLNSGEPFEIGPGYWEAKHRRLEERRQRSERQTVRRPAES